MKLNTTNLAVSVVLMVFLIGCGGDMPLQNEYEQISVGMSITEVEDLLGPATSSVEEISGNLKFWHLDGDQVITISVDDGGKVVSKDRGSK